MKKRYFADNQILPASDLNSASDFMEDNFQYFVQDAFGHGFIQGGTVTADSPESWSVFLEASVLYNVTGNRMAVSTPLEVDFTTVITAKGDPGVGNEYYITAYLTHTYSTSDPYSGTTDYRTYEDSYTLTMVAGTTAGAGAAVKPTMATTMENIVDILVDHTVYTRGTILTGDINVERQNTINTAFDESDTPIFAGLTINGTALIETLKIEDTDQSNALSIVWNEDDSSDRTLNFLVNAGNRTVDLSGNLTVEAASIINQDLSSDASPSWVGLTLSGDAAVNGGDLTTTATTFNLLNATATTINFGSACTTLNTMASGGVINIASDVAITHSSNALTITGGNVGIGSVPNSELSVEGDILRNTTNANISQYIGFQNSVSNSYVASPRGSVVINASSATAGANQMGGGNITIQAGNTYVGGIDSGFGGNVTINAGYNLASAANSAATISLSTRNSVRLTIDSDGGIFAHNLLGATGKTAVQWDAATKEFNYDTSALKYKENIRENPDTSWIHDINVVMYDRKDKSVIDEIGIIADSLKSIRPSLLCLNDKGELESYCKDDLIAPLVNEVQKLKTKQLELEARIATLEA